LKRINYSLQRSRKEFIKERLKENSEDHDSEECPRMESSGKFS